MNESGVRQDGPDVMQLQRRSKSLMSKKNWRRSILINSVGLQVVRSSAAARSGQIRASSKERESAILRMQRQCEIG